MDPLRDAWLAKFAREPRPWRGPSDLGPLARLVASPALVVGSGGGKTLVPGATTVDFAARAHALADARALPFRDGAFRTVLFAHLLGHLDARGRALAAREAVRALAPGGRALVADFARGDLRDGAGERVDEATFRRDGGILTHYFEEGELAALFPGCERLVFEVAERRARYGVRRRVFAAFARY